MPKRPFCVGRSNTGLGLFATRPIERGEPIVTYRGRRIPSRVAQELERTRGAKYMFEIDRRWTIDGSSRRNLARYTNHACRPNAECKLRRGELVFVALRNIKAGQEITLDYGPEYFDLYIREIGCGCASCRQRRERHAKSS